MQLIPKLLQLSRDLILITDSSGTCLEIGNRLQQLLNRHSVKRQDFETLVLKAFPISKTGGTVEIPLDQLGLPTTLFTILYQNEEQYVLFAKDRPLIKRDDRARVLAGEKTASSDEKDRRMHALLDESSDPIFSFKEDGTYLYVNNVFANTLGYDMEEIIGKTLWDIFPQEEADKRFAMVQKAFNTGEIDTIEVVIPLPEANKYFLTTVKPIKDDNGQVLFVICISKDITELRLAQEELETLTGILPICAHCKNIRNDTGAWQKLEEYISTHSEAEFTHGICPDCAHKHYSEYLDNKK